MGVAAPPRESSTTTQNDMCVGGALHELSHECIYYVCGVGGVVEQRLLHPNMNAIYNVGGTVRL